MTPKELAIDALNKYFGFAPTENDWLLDDGRPGLGQVIEDAISAERLRCAKIAWKMQQESFGGGTAIGNEIMHSDI